MIGGRSAAAGVASADARCTLEAVAAGFTGTFRAALAVGGASAASRFHPTGLPYFRPDGVRVVANDADLFSPAVEWEAPIDVNAYADNYEAESVFMGSRTIDGPPTNNCSDWTDSSATGKVDIFGGNFAGPLTGYGRDCTLVASIYCLQD